MAGYAKQLCEPTLAPKLMPATALNPAPCSVWGVSLNISLMLEHGRSLSYISDQDFPPALPCQNGGQCLYIFRMENGSLSELVDDFLEMTKGWRLPPGSVAIATSTSQLSRCGTAAYASSLAHNGGSIQKAFGGNVEWIPGVPILACGSNNKELQLDPLCSARFSHHPGWNLWPTVGRNPLQPD